MSTKIPEMLELLEQIKTNFQDLSEFMEEYGIVDDDELFEAVEESLINLGQAIWDGLEEAEDFDV